MVSLSRHLTLASITGLALACLCTPVFAADGVIRSIHYDPNSHHVLIDTTGPVRAIVNTLNIAGHKRVIVDLDNAEIGYELPKDATLLQQLSRDLPTVRNVTVNQYGGNGRPIVRILLDIDGDLQVIRMVKNQGPRLELEVSDSAAAQGPAANPYQQTAHNTTPAMPLDVDTPTPKRQTSSQPAYPQSYAPAYTPTPNYGQSSDSQALAQLRADNDRLRVTISNLQTQVNTQAASQSADLEGQVSALRQKLDTISRDNDNLRAQLSLKSQADSMQGSKDAEITRLKRVNQELQNQLASQTAVSQASVSNEEMKRTLVRMNEKYEALAAENQTLRASESQLRAKLNTQGSSSDVIAAKNLEITRLKTQLSAKSTSNDLLVAKNAEIDRLKSQLSQQSASSDLLVAKDAEISRLRAQQQSSATASPSELQDMRRQVTLAQQSLNQSIQTINEQNKEIAYLRNQVSQVKANVDSSSRDEIFRLENEKRMQATHIQELESQLAAKNTANTRSATASANTQSEIASLKRQLESVSGQYKSSLDDLNRQVQSRNQQIDELNRQLTDARTQARQSESLQRQVADLQSQAQEADALQKQVNDLQSQSRQGSSTLQRQLTDAQADARNKGQQVSSLQRQLTEVQAQAQQVDTLQRQVTNLQSQLNEASRKLAAQPSTGAGSGMVAASEVMKRDREIEDLKNRLASAQSKKPNSNNDETVALKNELANLTQENFNLKGQVESLQASKAATPAADSSQVRLLNEQIASLQAQYDQASREAKLARQDLEAARKATSTKAPATPVTASGGNTTALQKQISDLTRQLAEARRENTSLKSRSGATASQAQETRISTSSPEAQQSYKDAQAAKKAGETKKSLDKYKEALLLDQDNSRFAVDYSIALAEDQQYAEGIDVLRRFLQRNPNDRDAYNQLGKLYLLNDQADAANQAFSRAIPVSTLNNYATSLKKLGKMDDAESIFKMALKLSPNDSEVLFNLGNLYNAQNKLEMARNNYLQALQIKPDFAEAHYNLGLVFSKLGNRADAVTHLQKFLELSPNARNADTIRAYVEKLKA